MSSNPVLKGELGRFKLKRHFTQRRKEGAPSRKVTTLTRQGLKLGSNGHPFWEYCPGWGKTLRRIRVSTFLPASGPPKGLTPI